MMSRTPRAEQHACRLAISSLLLNPAAELPPSCSHSPPETMVRFPLPSPPCSSAASSGPAFPPPPPPAGICTAGNDNADDFERRCVYTDEYGTSPKSSAWRQVTRGGPSRKYRNDGGGGGGGGGGLGPAAALPLSAPFPPSKAAACASGRRLRRRRRWQR